MDNCIFCKIVKGEIPSYKIYEDEKVYAFLDIAKDAYGHTLVIPKKHCANLLDCDKEDLEAVIVAAQKIAKHFTEDCGFDGVNLINANGSAAEQSVFHLHLHLIPRKNGDGLRCFPHFGKKEFDMQKICDELRI